MNKLKKRYYTSGEEILVGDLVKLGESPGKIVFVVESQQFSKNYPKKEWEYLKQRVGIETEKYGLVHENQPDEDLIFIKRQDAT